MSEVKVMRQALVIIDKQSREITRLRAALAKYADHERWQCTDKFTYDHQCLSDCLHDWWMGERTTDLTPGWRIAEEALGNDTQEERT